MADKSDASSKMDRTLDKNKRALDELKKTESILEDTINVGSEICSDLSIQREKLTAIKGKVEVVNNSMDTAKMTLRSIDKRAKYWWIPWW